MSRIRPCGSLGGPDLAEEVYWQLTFFESFQDQRRRWLVVECMRQHLKRRVKEFVSPFHTLRERFGPARSFHGRLDHRTNFLAYR